MKRTEKVQWWVPFSDHIVIAKADLAKHFPRIAIIRIMVIVLCIYGMTAYALPKYIPEIEFDWIQGFLLCFVFMAVILGYCSLIAFIPPMVTVTSKGITVTQGQNARLYQYDSIHDIRVTKNVPGQLELIFNIEHQATPQRYSISPKVDEDKLKALISNTTKRPTEPRVHGPVA